MVPARRIKGRTSQAPSKPNSLRVFFASIFLTMAISSAAYAIEAEHAEVTSGAGIGYGDLVYVVGANTNIRQRPQRESQRVGQLSVGTPLMVGSLSNEPPYDQFPHCPIDEPSIGTIWVCVRYDGLVPGDQDSEWLGWVSLDLVSRNQPSLEGLIDLFDKEPKESEAARRKWIERAASLDPSDENTRRRLLAFYTEIGDQQALATSRKRFARYMAVQEFQSSKGPKSVLVLSGDTLAGTSAYTGGILLDEPGDRPTSMFDAGELYYLYSQGAFIGFAEVTLSLDCKVRTCPGQTIVRTIGNPGASIPDTAIATNFWIPKVARDRQKITSKQERLIERMATNWVRSPTIELKDKAAFVDHIARQGDYSSLGIGRLAKDGRRFIFGSWVLGSANDQKYGDVDSPFETLLFIAEESKYETFLATKSPQPLVDAGCSYVDHLDVNLDGSDEMLFLCEQLEGQRGYLWLRRTDSDWVMGDPLEQLKE